MTTRNSRQETGRGDATARQAFGDHLRRGRLALRLTQAQLAQRAGISIQTVRSLERGEPGVTLDVVFRVLAGLGIAETVAESANPERTPIGELRKADMQRKRAPRRTQH